MADSYDLMNDLMSAGAHRLWKNYFVQQLKLKPEMKILDMAGGTGMLSAYIDSISALLHRLNTIDTFLLISIECNLLQLIS